MQAHRMQPVSRALHVSELQTKTVWQNIDLHARSVRHTSGPGGE